MILYLLLTPDLILYVNVIDLLAEVHILNILGDSFEYLRS